MAKVWLITGSGSGLGRDIAKAALAAGDCVVAGARRTEELAPLVAQYGEWVKPVKEQYFENVTPVTGRGFGKIGTAYFALAMERWLWHGLRPFTRWPW